MKDHHEEPDDDYHEDEDRMFAEIDAFAYQVRMSAMSFAMAIGKERTFQSTSEYVKSAAEIYSFLIKDCLVPVEPEETEAPAMGMRN